MRTYTAVYFGAALIAMFLTPVISRIAKARGFVDAPGVRKVHTQPVPRIGGLAIMLGTFGPIVAVFLLSNVIGRAFRENEAQLIGLLAAGLFMCVVGLIDDIRGLRARTKLLAQLVAAVAVCIMGVRITDVETFGAVTVRFGWLAWPITILWILGITNAVNLIDGLDGLAAGIALVACGTIAIFALWSHQTVMAVIMLALLGSLTGFMFFNFNPAKIFMGDGGTYFIGFLIAGSSVLSAQKKATLVGLALPLLALGVPVFDMLFSVLRRVLERRSIFAPDRGHIHHRLLAMGLKHRQAVIVVHLVTLLTAGVGICMLVLHDAALIFVCAGIVMLLVVFRLVGAVRLKEALEMMQRNVANARAAKEERRCFEETQLRMREAGSFQQRWQVACAMADTMKFQRLVLTQQAADGRTTWTLTWHNSQTQPDAGELITVTIPLLGSPDGGAWRLEAAFLAGSSLEDAGRRITLLGRLVDEHFRPEMLAQLHDEAAAEAADAAAEATGEAPREDAGRAMKPPIPSAGSVGQVGF
ncbi:MAG: undecaprenyl/decaprenyl-phosphate alpha-N-acetylglucosaminyl 1-phosphate transferase [Planctomycetes bacterium]|nr:undecaprenyl/decaprenyl-phosphate alpha-N-acetylglucosaminyl 1-phosphate transferase [Planctomycetota bacterium]